MTPQELADYVFANIQVNQTAEFAAAIKQKFENYSVDQQRIIDEQLLSVGIDVNAACRVKHPPAP